MVFLDAAGLKMLSDNPFFYYVGDTYLRQTNLTQ